MTASRPPRCVTYPQETTVSFVVLKLLLLHGELSVFNGMSRLDGTLHSYCMTYDVAGVLVIGVHSSCCYLMHTGYSASMISLPVCTAETGLVPCQRPVALCIVYPSPHVVA